ncbi:MAG: DUF1566 domain-containing protein [Proteobacteria bacterium]|nr:DUF1566 domain-containing protein [Pseudomonadota bacterium]
MSTITLDEIQARQTELATLIEQYRTQSAQRVIEVPGTTVVLQAGEHYAGSTLEPEGMVKHDIVLLAARPDRRMTWQDAMEWAASVGGQLPDRQEQALLFANCKQHLQGEWHWSSEEHENASAAWHCDFFTGYQSYSRKSYEGCAVAVRRV